MGKCARKKALGSFAKDLELDGDYKLQNNFIFIRLGKSKNSDFHTRKYFDNVFAPVGDGRFH